MYLWFAIQKALPESEGVAAQNKFVSIGRFPNTEVHGICLIVVRDHIHLVIVRIYSVGRQFLVIFRMAAVFIDGLLRIQEYPVMRGS